MNEKILERLKNEFAFIGDEKISGHTAMKIINNIVKELTIPKEVEPEYCRTAKNLLNGVSVSLF